MLSLHLSFTSGYKSIIVLSFKYMLLLVSACPSPGTYNRKGPFADQWEYVMMPYLLTFHFLPYPVIKLELTALSGNRRGGIREEPAVWNLSASFGIPYPLWSHCHPLLWVWSARHPFPSTSLVIDDFIQAKNCDLEICCWKVWVCAWFECLMAVWPWQVSGPHCHFSSAKWNWHGSDHFHSKSADHPRAEQKSLLSRGQGQ